MLETLTVLWQPPAIETVEREAIVPEATGSLQGLVGELDVLLAANNVAAENCVQRLRQCWAGQCDGNVLDALEQAIERLDYPAAREQLAGLLAKKNGA